MTVATTGPFDLWSFLALCWCAVVIRSCAKCAGKGYVPRDEDRSRFKLCPACEGMAGGMRL